MPADAIYVGRPSKFGNPWKVLKSGAIINDYGSWRIDIRNSGRDPRQWVVDQFQDWLTTGDSGLFDPYAIADMRRRRQLILNQLPTLHGRDLACWCPTDAPCHGAVLLALVNQEANA